MDNKQDLDTHQKVSLAETKTESDAVHPRFITENPVEISKCEQNNYFYCKQCKLYFAPTYEGLRIHFDREIITHAPIGACFYCKGDVKEYYYKQNLKLYHNCPDRKNCTD